MPKLKKNKSFLDILFLKEHKKKEPCAAKRLSKD
jgi:hypothetical protein